MTTASIEEARARLASIASELEGLALGLPFGALASEFNEIAERVTAHGLAAIFAARCGPITAAQIAQMEWQRDLMDRGPRIEDELIRVWKESSDEQRPVYLSPLWYRWVWLEMVGRDAVGAPARFLRFKLRFVECLVGLDEFEPAATFLAKELPQLRRRVEVAVAAHEERARVELARIEEEERLIAESRAAAVHARRQALAERAQRLSAVLLPGQVEAVAGSQLAGWIVSHPEDRLQLYEAAIVSGEAARRFLGDDAVAS